MSENKVRTVVELTSLLPILDATTGAGTLCYGDLGRSRMRGLRGWHIPRSPSQPVGTKINLADLALPFLLLLSRLRSSIQERAHAPAERKRYVTLLDQYMAFLNWELSTVKMVTRATGSLTISGSSFGFTSPFPRLRQRSVTDKRYRENVPW